MLGLQPIRRTRWDAVNLSAALAALGLAAFALSLPENFGMAVGLLVAALVVAVAGALSHPRTDVKALIALKAEGAALLNLDLLSMLKRGDAKDAAHALQVFRIAVTQWVEEALPSLRRAGATDGDVSDFTTIISFTPTYPAINEEHANVKGILAERLQRLRPIISRLEAV